MFWTIMRAILSIPQTHSYGERISYLLAHKVGLWDIYASCSRENSADAKIKNPVPNDIQTLIEEHPDLHVIFLNGREAEKGFKKFFPDIPIESKYLPSSSPAHAVRLEEKIETWREITGYL